jgi:hypothetical protein
VNYEQLKTEVEKQVLSAIGTNQVSYSKFCISECRCLSEEPERVSMEFEVIHEIGNLKHAHSLNAGWDDIEGIGLELGEDGDIYKITKENIYSCMYWCAATHGLEDQYCD